MVDALHPWVANIAEELLTITELVSHSCIDRLSVQFLACMHPALQFRFSTIILQLFLPWFVSVCRDSFGPISSYDIQVRAMDGN